MSCDTLDYSRDYDFSGTAFSTDPGVHNDRPAGRYVTRAEQLAAIEAAALAKARRECERYPEEAPDEDMEAPRDD